MKIAFLNITQNLVDRGAETFVRELSIRLENNYEVFIIHGSKIPPNRWPIIWRFFIDPNGLTILFWTLKKLPVLWKEKFDVVIPINGGWQSALVRITTWLYGGKVVISGQSGMGWDDRNNLWNFPDMFVAISSFAKVWAKKVNPFIRVDCITNGVNLQKFSPKGLKFDTKLQHPIVLCVAALTPGKRVDLVVRAVAKLGNVSLLVVGDGQLKEKIQSTGEELLGDKFQLIKMPYDELPTAYRAADIFSLVSESYHSFEIVLVEAMATGLGVVANDDPIRREIVGDVGLFVDPTNAGEYARTLRKALDTNWGDKPRKQAEKFSWDRIAEQYEKLFEELR